MTNIKVTLDRTVSEDFPDAEELVRRQLSFSRLHEVIRETLQVDPDVRVSLENDQLVAKFYDHGASLPYAPGFYVIKSLDQYKNKQPARLLQEIAACRNYLRDHIVNNMVPSAKGVPNLELLADVLSVENVQLDNHPPTADIAVRLSVERVNPDNLYANEREVFGRLFELGGLSPGEIFKRYIEVIKMGMSLRLPPNPKLGTSILNDTERTPLLLHMLSLEKMITNNPNRILDMQPNGDLVLMGIWDKLTSPEYIDEDTFRRVNLYIQKMLQQNPNSFIAEPIYLKNIYIAPNSDDYSQDRVH